MHRVRMSAAASGVRQGSCHYKEQCSAFLKSLGIDEAYFLAEHDRCYCPTCATHIPDVLECYSAHGHPYEVPKGWCGFGLHTKRTAAAKKVFEKWAVSFHGCPSGVISSILEQGELLMPGDKMIDGTKLPNRLTRGDPSRIGLYTSPSIKYSELDIYTKPVQWRGHKVRTVLQCRQNMDVKPPELRIEGETIGWSRRFGDARFSQHFRNNEIERFTEARGSIIPYRVLVGLDITTREHEEEQMAEIERKRMEEKEIKRKYVEYMENVMKENHAAVADLKEILRQAEADAAKAWEEVRCLRTRGTIDPNMSKERIVEIFAQIFANLDPLMVLEVLEHFEGFVDKLERTYSALLCEEKAQAFVTETVARIQR